MQTSSHVKEIRQCNCQMCKMIRANSQSFTNWGEIRAQYRKDLREIVKGGDPENYNKHLSTRDYDA